MATAEQVIQRKDGSEVKIVAQEFFGAGLVRSIGVHVLRRENPESAWVLCSDRPQKNWLTMSVDEYIQHGRSEMLQTISIGEILKVVNRLEKPQPDTAHAESVAEGHTADYNEPQTESLGM